MRTFTAAGTVTVRSSSLLKLIANGEHDNWQGKGRGRLRADVETACLPPGRKPATCPVRLLNCGGNSPLYLRTDIFLERYRRWRQGSDVHSSVALFTLTIYPIFPQNNEFVRHTQALGYTRHLTIFQKSNSPAVYRIHRFGLSYARELFVQFIQLPEASAKERSDERSVSSINSVCTIRLRSRDRAP